MHLITLVRRVLGTFAFGLGVLAFVLALLPINDAGDCGTLLQHDVTCAGTDGRLAIVVLVAGVAVTCLLARWMAKDPPARGEDEEPPTVYPGGAQV